MRLGFADVLGARALGAPPVWNVTAWPLRQTKRWSPASCTHASRATSNLTRTVPHRLHRFIPWRTDGPSRPASAVVTGCST